jgi:arsenate reductase-like glutaredoxin family protein
MKALADNLYFKNLDNNAGVFHHLLDSAEEEECKEAILAYFFLYISKTPQTALELDRVIEQWFKDTFNFEIDFEIEDALSKLTRFGIINQREDKYEALNLAEARTVLDEKWDNIF